MCVLALAWAAHPRWLIVLAGNRDELHARPAAPLAGWRTPEHVIAGRDLEAGGTWLGVSEQGRLAVVTNVRGHGAPKPGGASRGALVRDLLAGDGPLADPASVDLTAFASFNPFNLLYADHRRAGFLSNRPQPMRTMLAPGIHGLSNGALNAPWPKTMQLKAGLRDWLVKDGDDPAPLLDLLRSERLPAIGRAPDQPSDMPQEPRLSPIFIRDSVYGTRCGTVVLIDRNGQGLIAEQRFGANGEPAGMTSLRFAWP